MTVRDETATRRGAVVTPPRKLVGDAALEAGDGVKGRASRLLAAGGILAALGAASCCVIPFALFTLGVSGAWIGNLTALEPYQPIFAAVSLSFISFRPLRLPQKRQVVSAAGYCATPQSDRFAQIGLLTATLLPLLPAAVPYRPA